MSDPLGAGFFRSVASWDVYWPTSGLTAAEMERASISMAEKKLHRSAGRRRSHELEQERVSKKQLADAWDPPLIVSGVDPDLGEDLLVRIHDDGSSTGLSFYVQLKSTTNLGAVVPKRRQDSVAYSFAVKDLLHWEGSNPPVVLVVWDVKRMTGVWQDVPDAIEQLDKQDKTWSTRQSARVLFPTKHTTDRKGQNALRATVAHHTLPMLARGREVLVTPSFHSPRRQRARPLSPPFNRPSRRAAPSRLERSISQTFGCPTGGSGHAA